MVNKRSKSAFRNKSHAADNLYTKRNFELCMLLISVIRDNLCNLC